MYASRMILLIVGYYSRPEQTLHQGFLVIIWSVLFRRLRWDFTCSNTWIITHLGGSKLVYSHSLHQKGQKTMGDPDHSQIDKTHIISFDRDTVSHTYHDNNQVVIHLHPTIETNAGITSMDLFTMTISSSCMD